MYTSEAASFNPSSFNTPASKTASSYANMTFKISNQISTKIRSPSISGQGKVSINKGRPLHPFFSSAQNTPKNGVTFDSNTSMSHLDVLTLPHKRRKPISNRNTPFDDSRRELRSDQLKQLSIMVSGQSMCQWPKIEPVVNRASIALSPNTKESLLLKHNPSYLSPTISMMKRMSTKPQVDQVARSFNFSKPAQLTFEYDSPGIRGVALLSSSPAEKPSALSRSKSLAFISY